MQERTLSIIKPDAVARGAIGGILKMIEDSGLKLVSCKMLRMSTKQAEGFYEVHKTRPFFGSLVEFMTSGPVVVSVLEGEDAIKKYRDLMGPTDSAKAGAETIRGNYGTNIERNAVHGSDGPDTARVEVAYFFSASELRTLE